MEYSSRIYFDDKIVYKWRGLVMLLPPPGRSITGGGGVKIGDISGKQAAERKPLSICCFPARGKVQKVCFVCDQTVRSGLDVLRPYWFDSDS